MSFSKPAQSDANPREHSTVHAVDSAGQVWVHPNPAELYRFIAARNQLLSSIAAGSR